MVITPAIAGGGAFVRGSMLAIQIRRNGAQGGGDDTMEATARLLGIRLEFGVDQFSD